MEEVHSKLGHSISKGIEGPKSMLYEYIGNYASKGRGGRVERT